MAANPRQDLYLEISRNLTDGELTDLRTYVSGTKILSEGFVQKANAHQICNQLEKEQKLKPGDLSLLADLLRKIGRHDYAEKAEKIAEDERKGKKTRRKRKRKRRRGQSREEDLSEESSSVGNDPHVTGPAPSQTYFSPVAKAVGSSWVKFAEDQLGLTAQDIHAIQLRHPYSKQHQAVQALELWRDRRGRKACRVKLAQALRRGGFQHAADNLETYNNQEVKISDCLADNTTDSSDYISDRKVSNGMKQQMIKKQRTEENGSGTQHLNGETENGSVKKQTASSSCEGHATSGCSEDSSEDDSQCEKCTAGFETLQQSNISFKRKKRRKKKQKENISIKRKKMKNHDSRDTTDDDQNCVNGDLAINDTKSAIHSTFLKIHEKVFDEKIVRDDHEFERCMDSMKKIESVISDSEDEQRKLQSAAKLRIKKRVNNKIAEVAENMFSDSVLDPANRETFHKVAECFKRYAASVKKARRGCVLCYLDFADVGCYDTFWRGYTDGSLSDTLTPELITDDMRAAEGGADLYIHVRVLDSATEDGDFSDQDPSGTADRGPPHPGASREHSGQGPPAPGSSNHGDDTPPGYHGDDTGGQQVSGGGDVIQVKQEPAEQVASCCMMGTVKSEIDTDGLEVKKESELDRQFAAIADHLGSMWERLASSLGFNTDYIRDLTARLPPSLRPHQLICDWMERNVGDVTLEQLVQALRDAGIHEVADSAASGQLFVTGEYCGAAKEKPDDDWDVNSSGQKSSPAKWDGYKSSSSSGSSSSESEEESDDRSTERDDDDVMLSERERPDSASSKYSSSGEEEEPEFEVNPDFYDQVMLIANKLEDNWTWLALQLGFSSTDVGRISRSYSPNRQAKQCLEEWVQREQWGATIATLSVGLRTAGLHQIADEAETGSLFQEDVYDGSWGSEWKGQDDEVDGSSSDGDSDDGEQKSDDRSPDATDRQVPVSVPGGSHSNEEGGDFSLEDGTTSLDSASQRSTVSPTVYPTGEDALAWNDCLQDFFKTDEDTTRSIQQTWPSNLLVKHLIRDRFFHSYLCEYWKQYQSFPCTLTAFVEFATKMSVKQLCNKNDVSDEHSKSVYENICIVVGKAAFENHANHNSMYVYKSQLEWGDIQQLGLGWLEPVDSSEAEDAFQFVHDSTRQYLMAVWVAHTVRTQTDCTELLRICADEKSAHLPITCYSLAHLLGITDSPPTYLSQFVTLLMQQVGGSDNSKHLISLVTTIIESKQLDVLLSLTQNLFTDKTLDLSALPKISHHGIHCLTQLIKSTTLIQTIRLPENIRIKNVLNNYPFGQNRFKHTNHTNSIRYLSYLPLFELLPSTSNDIVAKIYFATIDQEINIETIQQYFQFGHSLKKITVRSSKFTVGTLGNLSKSLLFTPNVTDVVIALKEVDSEEIEQVMVVLSCLNKLANVEFTEYRSRATCCLSWGKFVLKCKTTPNTWRSVLSFRPSDIREIVLDGTCSAAAIAILVSSFPHLTHLVKLRFERLKVSSSGWSTLFQGLASRPSITASVDSSVADGSPPLEILGCSDCVLTDREVLLLSGLLKTFRNLKEIDLSHNYISDEAVPGLAESLGSCQNLKKVDLSYNKLSDRGDFLPPLPNLEEIDLSENAISDEAVPGLAKGLDSCPNLRRANLSYNKISNKGALVLLLEQLQRLQVDITSNDRISPNLQSLLTRRTDASQVTKLHLTSGEFSITAVHLLLQFLPQLPNLQELALCVSCEGEEEAEHINQLYGVRHVLKKLKLNDRSSNNMIRLATQMFQHLPLLEEIDLSDNEISDEAVPGLAEGLGSCQNLKKVNLSHNKLSDRGAFIPPLPNLEEIDLSHNAISDEAVPGLAKCLVSCQNLKKVNLSWNKLSDVRELTAAFINLPSLTCVELDHNSIRDLSLPAIAAWLKVRTDVERVWLWSNRFSAEGVRDFVRTMKGKAYGLLSGDLLYDGSQADVGESVGSGGEDVRREEQEWERLRREAGWIDVKVGQLRVWIDHKGPRSNILQLMPL